MEALNPKRSTDMELAEEVYELREMSRLGLVDDAVDESVFRISEGETFDEQGTPVERPIPPKMELALRLYLCGLTGSEACRQANVSRSWFQVWLGKPETQKLVERVKGELEERFLALQFAVTRTISQALEDPNMNVRLKAASTWLTATRTQNLKVEVTAEDVVAQLLNQEELKTCPNS